MREFHYGIAQSSKAPIFRVWNTNGYIVCVHVFCRGFLFSNMVTENIFPGYLASVLVPEVTRKLEDSKEPMVYQASWNVQAPVITHVRIAGNENETH